MDAQLTKTEHKINDIERLASLLDSVRSQGKRIVQCHGVFDLLHIGHIRHFQEAKTFGDVLVVTLTPDEHVNKGPSRPVFGQDLRAEAVASLDCVDYVAINRWPLAVEAIELLRPNSYVKGSDYQDAESDRTGGIALEEEAVRRIGGSLVFTNDITFSSSSLINRNMPVFPQEVVDYLADISSRYSSDDVVKYLDNARNLKVLVLGETIIDEYVYCDPLGKTGKDPALAARYVSGDKFAGGTVAVANHVAGFSDNVTMLTFLGGTNSQEEFVRQNVKDPINDIYLYMPEHTPTIVKRRFISVYPFQTLFEVYEMSDDGIDPRLTESLCRKLDEILPEFDLVIVTDYGHGMFGPEAVKLLCEKARFLAVNTQLNAGNRGFNTVSKYPRADFICVSENEIRLEARSHSGDLHQIISEINAKLSCECVLITRGPNGCLSYRGSEGFFNTPALAARVVDRIGAGDAVFFVAALCAAQRAPMELVGLIGNAAGAEAVATIGHQSSIQSLGLSRHIEALLK